MTMVAAFRVNGVPILVGDFLLTDIQPGAKHIFLPTKPELSHVVPDSGHRRLCGLRKKIHKIGERLVVGFTGSLAPGALLMKGLQERFGNTSVMVRELESFLAEMTFPGKKETELVGWVWENRPLCFQWKGLHPETLQLVESAYSGSGGNHFLNEVMHADGASMSPGLQTALDKAIYIGANKAGKVLLEELMAAKNLEHNYGFGAELIFWDGARFSYVEKLAFVFWNVAVGPDNELMVAASNVSAVYRNFGTFSVVQVCHMGPRKGPGGGLESKNTYVNVITPLYDEMRTFDARTVGRQSFDARLWFSGFVVKNPRKGITVTCSIVSEFHQGVESPFTGLRDGVLFLNCGQLSACLPASILN